MYTYRLVICRFLVSTRPHVRDHSSQWALRLYVRIVGLAKAAATISTAVFSFR